MLKHLHIPIFLLTFAIGIVRSHDLMIRELSTSPFPINKVDITKKLKDMPKRLTKEEFIERAMLVHGDKYDYSKVNYVDAHTKVCITCQEHGDFWQMPYSHLNGKGCAICGREKTVNCNRLSQDVVIEKMIATHGNFYNYSKFVYVDMHTKGVITCPIHGDFLQSAHEHISGQGCPICSGKQKWTEEMFLGMAHEKFGSKFIYHHNFVGSNTITKITCPIHGDFYTSPRNHLRSSFGCPKCAYDHFAKKQTYSLDLFIQKAKNKWGDTYDYSMINESNYINTKNKVPIICHKHGLFWQNPNNHLNGHGCPHCKRSLGEDKVALFLYTHKIKYETQYIFNNNNILCTNNYFRVDFYLPENNTIIEYNGQQHYKEVLVFSERTLEQQQERDYALRQYCKESNINLIEIPYWDYDNIDCILKNKLKIKRL